MENIRSYFMGDARRLFSLFLLLSVLFHFFTVVQKFELRKDSISYVPNDEIKEPIKIRLISDKKKQIVESEETESLKNLNRIKDRFLSKKDNFFEKETVTKKIGKFQNATEKSSTSSPSKKKVSFEKLAFHNLKVEDFSKFKVGKNAEKAKSKSQQQENSKSSVSKVSQTNDYIDDVPTGELTQLNTTEFKFYGFYYRIKQRLKQHWGNSLREKAHTLKKRRLASSSDRITALVVILDSIKRIVKVHLKSTSGVEELDSAAIESFNKAGPFPNPPKEMLENGRAKIEWSFVVKT